MKLEVKDLILYLPYGLKMYHKGVAVALKKANQKYNPTTLKMLSRDGSFWVGKESESRSINQDVHKPIFRPLSDLIKVDFKEELFKYYQTLGITVKLVNYDSGNDNPFDMTLTVTYKIMGEVFTDVLINRGSTSETPYHIIVWLIENHFDIFGLIENGLAIDINTLNK